MSNRIETAKGMSVGIGTIILYRSNGDTSDFRVKARVIDMRQRYGMVDALIEPIAGEGSKWVNASGLLVVNENGERVQIR